MHFLTAAGVGILTVFATAILWIVVRFVLPIAFPFFLSRIGRNGSRERGRRRCHPFQDHFSVALLGFVGGFVWMIWKR